MGDHSRALLLGAAVTATSASELGHRLEASSVNLTVDPLAPGSLLAGRVLLTTLRRTPGRLSLDPTGLTPAVVDDLVARVAAIDADRGVAVRPSVVDDFRVHIGPSAARGVLRGLPDRHGFHITTRGVDLGTVQPASALGSISTAAALAAEIFKESANVIGVRGRRHRHLSFCPVTLTSHPGRAPAIPRDWRIDAMLIGLGGIGTGSALILSELPVEGCLDLVDPQDFAAENLGTYSIGDTADVLSSRPKTDLAASALTRFDANQVRAYAADLVAMIDTGRLEWPRIVLTGLDSAAARRDAQRLWPDRLIDGATGDTMVGLHDVTAIGQPCLACFFPEPQADGSAALTALASATGLPRAVVARGADLLSPEHLSLLSAQQQAKLRPHLGKEICGLARAFGLTDLADEGYRPAVPFVSLMAATLAVGRLLAHETGLRPPTNFVQFDALAGPRQLIKDVRRALTNCYCVTREAVVTAVRTRRGTRVLPPARAIRDLRNWDPPDIGGKRA